MKVFIPEKGQQGTLPLQQLQQLEPATLESLDLQDVMDYLQPQERDNLLRLALSKIKHGGTLEYSGIDYVAAGKMLYMSKQNPAPAIYGNGKQSFSAAIEEKTKLAQQLGLNVFSAYVEGISYFVAAKKG